MAAFNPVEYWSCGSGAMDFSFKESPIPDDMDMSPVTVLLFGHSFIHRLATYIDNNPRFFNLGIDTRQASVNYYGWGGAKVATLLQKQHFSQIDKVKPEIVFIQVGTCDLCTLNKGPEVVGDDIHKLALKILNKGVRRVIVGQILFRAEAGKPDGMSLVDFNKKVQTCNSYLDAVVNDTPRALFWHHYGFWKDHEAVLDSKDGTHLNDAGMYKFYKSMRGFLIPLVKRFRPSIRPNK